MINFKDMIGGFLNDSLLDETNSDNKKLLAKLETDEKFFTKTKQIAITPLDFSKEMALEFYQNVLPNDLTVSKELKEEEICFHKKIVQLLINNIDESLIHYKKRESYETYIRKYIGSKLSEINPNLYSYITAFIDQAKLTYDADKAVIEAEKKAKQSSKGASASAPSAVSTVASASSATATQSTSGSKSKKTSIDYNDVKEWVYSLPTIKEISSKSADEILKLGLGLSLDNQGNLNGFYKMKNIDLELKKIDKQINIIVTAFAAYNKNVSEDLSLILTREKRAYYDQFLKILPFFVDKSEVGAKDVFIDMLDSKNYILYFYLDGLYYEFISKETDNSAPINHYMIDNIFKITKIPKPKLNIILKSDTFKMTNIVTHKHYKNWLVNQIDKSNIFRSFKNTYLIYKQLQNSNENYKKIFRFIEYMFHQPIENGEIVPKKSLISNLFNLFILTGNLETMYKYFGSENTIDSHTNFTLDILFIRDQVNPKKEHAPDIIISLKELGLDKLTTDDDKYNHIKYFDIAKLLTNKFKDFITTNIASFDWDIKLDIIDQYTQMDQKINELFLRLNNIGYPNGIPDSVKTLIESCKKDLLKFFYSTFKKPENDEGINLINAYNYFDIIDNIDLLTYKIDDIEKRLRENPTSVTQTDKQSLKDMVLRVNNNFKKPASLVFYHLLLDISYLRKISFDVKIGLTNRLDYVFIDHIIDLMVVYRQDYDVKIPFNKNLLTHSNRALRATGPNIDIDEIYSLVKTNFNTFCYGNFTRVKGADCGETLILNIFNFLIFDQETGNLDESKLPDNVHPEIRNFYKKYNRLEKINTDARYQWDEIMYDYEFIMQTHDYCVDPENHVRYKVYSQFENLNGFVDTFGIPRSEAIERFKIYDEAGNLLPGKKENKYAGHTIRPGYISIVKILNKLTGFDKISEKYNDRFVMSNLTLNSLKEILQTFKNSTKLDDYFVLEGTNVYDDQIRVNFSGNFNLTMRYPHAFVEYGGIKSDSRRGVDNFNPLLIYTKLGVHQTPPLRYFQKEFGFLGIHTTTYELSHFRLTTYNIDAFKIKANEIISNYLYLKTINYDIEFILNLYKLCLSDEERITLFQLPSEKFVEKYNPEDNLLFKIFGKKSDGKLYFDFYAYADIFDKIKDYRVIKHIIYYLDGDVNKPLDNRKDTILSLLFRANNESMLREIMKQDKPDILIINQYGNNVLHYQQFIYDEKKIESNIKILKEYIDPQTWDKMVTHRNLKDEIPFMSILSKSNIYIKDLIPNSNRVKVNLIKHILINYFKKENYKIINSSTLTLKRKSQMNDMNNFLLGCIFKITDIISNQDIKRQVFSLLIKIFNKNSILFNQIDLFHSYRPKLLDNLSIFNKDEENFLRLIINKDNRINIINSNIIFNKELLKKYNINPWFYLDVMTPDSISFSGCIKLLVDEKKFDMLPLIGLINNPVFCKECVNWSIKNFHVIKDLGDIPLEVIPEEIRSKGLKNLVDYNGNTIYHNLAIMTQYFLKGWKNMNIDIKKLFGFLNRDTNREIFIKENKDGWKLIDIFSWFTYDDDSKNPSINESYDDIRTIIGLLDDYFKKFDPATQNIEDYVIVLTRHIINKWYRYFDMTKNLMTTINGIVALNPNVNNKLLDKLDKTFDLHLYDKFLSEKVDILKEKYLSEPAYIITIGQENNPLFSKTTFSKSNDITITHPLTENQLKKLNLKLDPYEDIKNAFDAIVSSRQVVEAQPAKVEPSVSANESDEKSAENKYYLLYKKYKTKYLTLREKLSK